MNENRIGRISTRQNLKENHFELLEANYSEKWLHFGLGNRERQLALSIELAHSSNIIIFTIFHCFHEKHPLLAADLPLFLLLGGAPGSILQVSQYL
jgi:hypothetical protein